MMGLVGKWTAATAVAVLGLGFGAVRASAQDIIPGSGKPDENCYAEMASEDATGASIDTSSPKATEYSCMDGDPCDLDGVCGNNSCTFKVGVCWNVPDQAGCTAPSSLDSLKGKGHVNGVKGASGKFDVQVPQLLEGSGCGAFVDVIIPLKENKKGVKSNKAKLKIDAKAPKGTKPKKDKDKYDLVCLPREGACPGSPSGAFVD
jgi:hypothetical protein